MPEGGHLPPLRKDKKTKYLRRQQEVLDAAAAVIARPLTMLTAIAALRAMQVLPNGVGGSALALEMLSTTHTTSDIVSSTVPCYSQ